MATFVIDTTADWHFINSKTFNFYNNWEMVYSDRYEADWQSGNYAAAISGLGLRTRNGQLTLGTVTDIDIHTSWRDVYITELKVNAGWLAMQLRKNTSVSNQTIFSNIFASDDNITLGFGSDTINTFGGSDIIYGRSGWDTINSGDGDDIIYGGTGSDKLTGGRGSDYFVFDTQLSESKNLDSIQDFSSKEGDIVVLDHLVFRKIGRTGELADAAFYSSSNGRAHDATDRIIYNSSTGELSYDPDGNGAAGDIIFAKLTAGLKLSAGDFDII